MTMLAEHVDGVIGVDTHRDTLAAAALSPIGAVLAGTDSPANARGYRNLLNFARQQVPGRRCWALEGIGSYGAGLAAFLDQAGEQVVEVCRPKRAANRGGRKTDTLDAIRAAKEALTTEHLIQPRLRGEREALRVLLATRHGAVLASTAAINQLKALIVSGPDDLRSELRKLKRPAQIAYCAQFRDQPGAPDDGAGHAVHGPTRPGPAGRGQGARERDPHAGAAAGPRASRLARSRTDHRRPILVSWSHQGRFRSEAAFASFAGVSPIPASSGLTNRHRLNRSGDRQLNRAMHTITLIRMRLDPSTKTYVARKITEGKTSRDAQRYLVSTLIWIDT
ncbi:transposase [Streptomyces spiralis]|uniref:transposase n=1 Tax=Streptomyces spiralis TaxID=66376 RepID=UPI0036782842